MRLQCFLNNYLLIVIIYNFILIKLDTLLFANLCAFAFESIFFTAGVMIT